MSFLSIRNFYQFNHDNKFTQESAAKALRLMTLKSRVRAALLAYLLSFSLTLAAEAKQTTTIDPGGFRVSEGWVVEQVAGELLVNILCSPALMIAAGFIWPRARTRISPARKSSR